VFRALEREAALCHNEPVATFARREGWQVVPSIDLGTTARVLVVERDGVRYALKTARGTDPDGDALLTEYRVLRYLNGTPMQRYVPWVGAWLPKLAGFLMAYLRYPNAAEKGDATWMPDLARALRTLHGVGLPAITALADDRPHAGRTVTQRLRKLFDLVLRRGSFWAGLAEADRPALERVRKQYQLYVDLLPEIEAGLADAPVALTHGDLAGDNLMLTGEGRLALVDWGAARISAAWADVASLATYMAWPAGERHRFYRFYLGKAARSAEMAMECLDVLSYLYRYRACVQSLLWLNQGPDGLDAVGRAYFENQVEAL
jgi:aminoglycoside phosphotransferase (APT) family kinase protein